MSVVSDRLTRTVPATTGVLDKGTQATDPNPKLGRDGSSQREANGAMPYLRQCLLLIVEKLQRLSHWECEIFPATGRRCMLDNILHCLFPERHRGVVLVFITIPNKLLTEWVEAGPDKGE